MFTAGVGAGVGSGESSCNKTWLMSTQIISSVREKMMVFKEKKKNTALHSYIHHRRATFRTMCSISEIFAGLHAYKCLSSHGMEGALCLAHFART
jgi:hypothetical protein